MDRRLKYILVFQLFLLFNDVAAIFYYLTTSPIFYYLGFFRFTEFIIQTNIYYTNGGMINVMFSVILISLGYLYIYEKSNSLLQESTILGKVLTFHGLGFISDEILTFVNSRIFHEIYPVVGGLFIGTITILFLFSSVFLPFLTYRLPVLETTETDHRMR